MPLLAPPASAANNIANFVRPPYYAGTPAASPASFGGALAASAVISTVIWAIGELGGNKFRDEQIRKIRGIEPNSGNRSAEPPFKGGQSAGVLYYVEMSFGSFGTYGWGQLTAPVSALGEIFQNGISWAVRATDAGGDRLVSTGWTTFQQGGIKPTILGLKRIDGLPDIGGDPASTTPSTPTSPNKDQNPANPDNQPRIVPPKFSPALGWGNGKPVTTGIRAGLGLGTTPASPTKFNDGKPKNDGIGGFAPQPPAITPPSPTTTPKRPQTPTETPNEKPKTPPPTPTPPDSSNNSIMQKLFEVGAILGVIRNNTEPDAQRVNAKNGSCDALNSPSCTAQLKSDIKDPIINKQDGLSKALLGTNQAAQDGILLGMVTKLDKIQEFATKVYNASKLDKIYNFLTFFVTVHNAAMLSNSLLTTLEDTLSQGLATFGIKDVEGNPINIQENVNKTTRQIIESVIGAQNYTTLSENWTKANNIFRSGANLLYNVRSLWDSARSLQEMTGANLGQLMNSLRRDGVVTENAYPAKCESPLMINSGMERLQNLESAASHLNQITSTTYGITQTVAQLKDDKDNFDKALKEQPKKAGIKNDPEQSDALSSKFASLSPAIATENLVKPD